jgi:caffeoyl-CoA O-methyltransferase
VALDNVLWGGEITDLTKTDRDTLALRAVNERVRDDERVTEVLLPVADGMTLARKR